MDERQKELARHALGLPNTRKRSYRKHFVAGEGHDDYDTWIEMVAAGDAIRRRGSVLSGGDDIFLLTRVGAEKALDKGERLDPEDFSGSARPMTHHFPARRG